MKKVIIYLFITFCCFITYAQNTGIGTTTPLALLHVADSNVLFTGPTTVPVTTTFNPPVQGAGTRLMWYPQKGAFRVGFVDGAHWDKDSIGIYSFAAGYNSKANGVASIALGYNNNATGHSSVALGHNATVSGDFSTALGYFTYASGLRSTAIGANTTASGTFSIALGDYAVASGHRSIAMRGTASGPYSIAMGSGTASAHYSTVMGAAGSASGPYSTAMGDGTFASGTYSTAMGRRTKAKSESSLVIGQYNDTTATNRLLEIGNGTADNARSNAMTVLSNGNVGIGTTNPNAALQFNNAIANRKIVLYEAANNNHQYYGLGINGGTLRYQVDATTADHVFFAATNSTVSKELMRIKGNGNVGIGTQTPTRPLSFPPSIGEKILLYPGGAGEVGIGVYGNELRLHCDNPGSKVSFGTQDNAGNFTEAAKAQINGAYAFSIFGSLWANGTTYTSDERFKQNIQPISSPLQKLLQINGVEYEMRADAFPKNHFQKGKQIGLIAQNVEKVVPEAVNEMDGYKGVDYAKLVPLLIESIKEQQKQLDDKQKQIDELKKLVDQFIIK